jgi:hypothetical protein
LFINAYLTEYAECYGKFVMNAWWIRIWVEVGVAYYNGTIMGSEEA